MTESSKDKLFQIESKIENMLDKLIEEDEEFENKGFLNSLKLNDEISSSEENKDEREPFEKPIFFNQFFPNDERSLTLNSISTKKNYFDKNIIPQNELDKNRNIHLPLNNKTYNNYFPFNYNYIFPQPINNQNINNNFNSEFFGINKNINNSINSKNNETLSSSSFSYNFGKYNNFIRASSNKSLMNYGYQNFNNSFKNRNNIFIFYNSKKLHNSYYAGDKICFNNTYKNSNNNYKNNNFYNPNIEEEILLLEVNKILNKLGKIDQIIFNKLKGKFQQIICTHKGSRIFQSYLKSTHIDILHQIFLEIKIDLINLLKDNYANYFCKKLFDCLNQKDRIEYLSIIQNELNTLALDITATYPIQGIIEQLGSKAEKNIVYLGIKDYIPIFCYNIYGTHVLEKILSYFEDDFTKEIIEYVYNNFIDLAYHINGICIVKKLLLMTHKKDLHQKLKIKINDNALELIVHQYGNYVIQMIFENWDDNELENILNQYKNKYVYLSKQKYSSNAVERIIEKNRNNLEFYINTICTENNISELMVNNYGNYVIQKALKLSSGKIKEKLIQQILKNLHIIEDKKIIYKWEMIITSKTTF